MRPNFYLGKKWEVRQFPFTGYLEGLVTVTSLISFSIKIKTGAVFSSVNKMLIFSAT